MTEVSLEERAYLLGVGLKPLPMGMVPCRRCGIAVSTGSRTDADRVVTLQSRGYQPRDPEALRAWKLRQDARVGGGLVVGQAPSPYLPTPIKFGICRSCHAAEALADELVAAHPALRNRLGNLFREHVRAAIARLELLESPLDPEQAQKMTGGELLTLTSTMGLGGVPTWASRFVPEWDGEHEAETCTSEPWGHLDIIVRAAARDAKAEWLAARVGPRPVACPSGGCVFCGVDHVDAIAGTFPWSSFTAPARSLGGKARDKITGHICPACNAARGDNPAVGPGLLDRAVQDYADPDRSLRRGHPRQELDGVVAWATTGRPPSSTPWAHIDLDEVRTHLRSW